MRLILTRHAKSSWDAPVARDHDRPLAKRGIKAAAKIGDWLCRNGYNPAIVLCSTARRTRETWIGISASVAIPESVQFLPELYGAGTSAAMNALTQCPRSPVLMIGHNPTFAHFARLAVREDPQNFQFYRYPTCATLVCDFPAKSWAEISIGTAEVVDFVTPREL